MCVTLIGHIHDIGLARRSSIRSIRSRNRVDGVSEMGDGVVGLAGCLIVEFSHSVSMTSFGNILPFVPTSNCILGVQLTHLRPVGSLEQQHEWEGRSLFKREE